MDHLFKLCPGAHGGRAGRNVEDLIVVDYSHKLLLLLLLFKELEGDVTRNWRPSSIE